MSGTSEVKRRSYDQACPVAHALDVVGERWTLLIVRDLMFGPLRFTDLRRGLPGLAPNLLSERLRSLGAAGILERIRFPIGATERSVYALTPRGRELAPVVHELAASAWRNGTTLIATRRRHDCSGVRCSRSMDPERLGSTAWSATVVLPDAWLTIRCSRRDEAGSALARLRLGQQGDSTDRPDGPCVHTTLGTLLELRRGRLTLARASAEGRIELDVPTRTATELARLFGWA